MENSSLFYNFLWDGQWNKCEKHQQNKIQTGYEENKNIQIQIKHWKKFYISIKIFISV